MKFLSVLFCWDGSSNFQYFFSPKTKEVSCFNEIILDSSWCELERGKELCPRWRKGGGWPCLWELRCPVDGKTMPRCKLEASPPTIQIKLYFTAQSGLNLLIPSAGITDVLHHIQCTTFLSQGPNHKHLPTTSLRERPTGPGKLPSRLCCLVGLPLLSDPRRSQDSTQGREMQSPPPENITGRLARALTSSLDHLWESHCD